MTSRSLFAAPLAFTLALGGCPVDEEKGDGYLEECAECRDEKCQALVDNCSADDDCACMSDCLGERGVGAVEDECFEECDVTERPKGFAQLELCVAYACPDAPDECDTPDDWEPTDNSVSTTDPEIAGGTEPNCGIDENIEFDPDDGTVLQFRSEDGQACVRLERSDNGPGSLANTSWSLLDIRVGPLDGVAHVDANQDLCWYSSHHNFLDWAHVWTGTRRHSLMVELYGHDGERAYALHTFRAGPLGGECPSWAEGEDPVGEPLKLIPVNGG